MITSFKIFENIDGELTYDDVIDISIIETKIKHIFVDKYNDHTTFKNTRKFFSRATQLNIDRALNFAKKNNDEELKKLVLELKDIFDMRNDIKKYNI